MKISMEDLSHTRIKISDVFTHSIFSILIIFSASQMMIGVLQLSIQLTKLISPVKSYNIPSSRSSACFAFKELAFIASFLLWAEFGLQFRG